MTRRTHKLRKPARPLAASGATIRRRIQGLEAELAGELSPVERTAKTLTLRQLIRLDAFERAVARARGWTSTHP